MRISKPSIEASNTSSKLNSHREAFDNLRLKLETKGVNVAGVIERLMQFQVAIPSWALGAGGTRFGRFSMEGEPGNLEQKLEDIGLIHALTGSAGAISLHIPWDIPSDPEAIKEKARELDITFDAVNSNTFQDQPGQQLSYKFGSLSSSDAGIRQQAIAHNVVVIEHGKKLGSKALTVWLADGSSFPGQHNLSKALQYTQESLVEIYSSMPSDWNLLIEYKPFEPNFYSMVIPDWGTSLMLAEACGERAHTLVDLGHHLPNTNIEQIVSTLLKKGRLGGFHFNDSKYGDDDLTSGSIKPFQLFLIFNEINYGLNQSDNTNPPLAWMIDASHNLKDPLEDLMQSLEAIRLAYSQALIINNQLLEKAQLDHDITLCQEIIQDAYRTDVRPLLAEARLQAGAALSPVDTYRELNVRKTLIKERGSKIVATGL
jgi:L-rhamnose isomerase/sugar isomerase